MNRVDQRWWKRRVIRRTKLLLPWFKGHPPAERISHMALLSGLDVHQLRVGLPSDF